ncbi:MAG TPA: response regulator [Noviherbaspirillum sp.]|nr:response regulator [Noviherbaspirillum sp.]
MNETENAEIVIVDDSPSDALLTKRALQKSGIATSPLWLRDGVEALDYLFCKGTYAHRPRGALPRLVILDLKLPRIDGIKVVETIKADARLREIPIVMMSSSAEERDLRAAYRFGVNSYVVKPLDFAEFSKHVAQIGVYWMSVNRAPPESHGDGQPWRRRDV